MATFGGAEIVCTGYSVYDRGSVLAAGSLASMKTGYKSRQEVDMPHDR